MKYCVKCGTKLQDEAMFCSTCGNPTESAQFKNQTGSAQTGNSNPTVHYVVHKNVYNESNPKTTSETFRTLAKIFMIIGTVILSLYALFPLAWCLPMTLHYIEKINKGELPKDKELFKHLIEKMCYQNAKNIIMEK